MFLTLVTTQLTGIVEDGMKGHSTGKTNGEGDNYNLC
jgi:hypothetical protein